MRTDIVTARWDLHDILRAQRLVDAAKRSASPTELTVFANSHRDLTTTDREKWFAVLVDAVRSVTERTRMRVAGVPIQLEEAVDRACLAVVILITGFTSTPTPAAA